MIMAHDRATYALGLFFTARVLPGIRAAFARPFVFRILRNMLDFSFGWTPLLQLVLAALLGAAIGIERDLNGRPAGLRTSMIIAMGSCMFAIISGEGYADAAGTQDPTRIASIVVQGIGFIGAGVMLKGGDHVSGLTTAATIWLVAAIGLAVGANMPVHAIVGTVLALFMLTVLHPFSLWLEAVGNARVERQGRKAIKER
jgi:putative Mg2+ transporter-C (MgtC) family protein